MIELYTIMCFNGYSLASQGYNLFILPARTLHRTHRKQLVKSFSELNCMMTTLLGKQLCLSYYKLMSKLTTRNFWPVLKRKQINFLDYNVNKP